ALPDRGRGLPDQAQRDRAAAPRPRDRRLPRAGARIRRAGTFIRGEMSRGGHALRRGWCMTCTEPGAITPEELVAYGDGEAPERVLAPLRHCRRCRSEAERYAAIGRRLGGALRRFDCPTPHYLGELELGLLAAEESLTLARHVATCPRCADELRT